MEAMMAKLKVAAIHKARRQRLRRAVKVVAMDDHQRRLLKLVAQAAEMTDLHNKCSDGTTGWSKSQVMVVPVI
jgi:hypothetical protein